MDLLDYDSSSSSSNSSSNTIISSTAVNGFVVAAQPPLPLSPGPVLSSSLSSSLPVFDNRPGRYCHRSNQKLDSSDQRHNNGGAKNDMLMEMTDKNNDANRLHHDRSLKQFTEMKEDDDDKNCSIIIGMDSSTGSTAWTTPTTTSTTMMMMPSSYHHHAQETRSVLMPTNKDNKNNRKGNVHFVWDTDETMATAKSDNNNNNNNIRCKIRGQWKGHIGCPVAVVWPDDDDDLDDDDGGGGDRHRRRLRPGHERFMACVRATLERYWNDRRHGSTTNDNTNNNNNSNNDDEPIQCHLISPKNWHISISRPFVVHGTTQMESMVHAIQHRLRQYHHAGAAVATASALSMPSWCCHNDHRMMMVTLVMDQLQILPSFDDDGNNNNEYDEEEVETPGLSQPPSPPPSSSLGHHPVPDNTKGSSTIPSSSSSSSSTRKEPNQEDNHHYNRQRSWCRYFAVLPIVSPSLACERLKQLVSHVDTILVQHYQQLPFYQPPLFHVTVAWWWGQSSDDQYDDVTDTDDQYNDDNGEDTTTVLTTTTTTTTRTKRKLDPVLIHGIKRTRINNARKGSTGSTVPLYEFEKQQNVNPDPTSMMSSFSSFRHRLVLPLVASTSDSQQQQQHDDSDSNDNGSSRRCSSHCKDSGDDDDDDDDDTNDNDHNDDNNDLMLPSRIQVKIRTVECSFGGRANGKVYTIPLSFP